MLFLLHNNKEKNGEAGGWIILTVEIAGLEKSYQQNHNGSVKALEKIDLTIRSGQFVCLLGPSGCGKSTLLNMIAGLEQANCGSIMVNGKKVQGPGPERVMVFQEAALFPWLNVVENVEFGLKMLGIRKKQRREEALYYLELVHLIPFVAAYPHELSGGMRQRVAIARALAMNPEILLMDEPFAALDEETKQGLHRELQEIWQKTQKTIVFVTHNVGEAVCLADEIVLFTPSPGRIKEIFPVQIPRVRQEDDQAVRDLQQKIKQALREDVSSDTEWAKGGYHEKKMPNVISYA